MIQTHEAKVLVIEAPWVRVQPVVCNDIHNSQENAKIYIEYTEVAAMMLFRDLETAQIL